MSHVEHLRDAARRTPGLSAADRAQMRDQLVAFLQDTLVPHAEAEEAVLYPEWAQLIGHPDAAVPMVHDHRAIVERIRQLGDTNTDDVDALQELLYGLHALITVHFHKEEDIQLPVFDQQSPAFVADVLDRMEAASGHAHAHSHG